MALTVSAFKTKQTQTISCFAQQSFIDLGFVDGVAVVLPLAVMTAD